MPSAEDAASGKGVHRPSGATGAVALAVSLLTLTLYALTAAPDLPLVDSGELALAAYGGGVAHPPGFPPYLLLGWCFSHLPLFDSPIRALNLMSAFFGALSAGACVLITERSIAIWKLGPGGAAQKRRPVEPLALLAAAAAGLIWATGRNAWSWSVVTEVYSLNAFVLSAAWACALIWACAACSGRGSRRWLLAAVAFAGLGLANHTATSVLIFPALLGVVLSVDASILRARGFLLRCVVIVVACQGLYLYLWIAASHDPGLGWGGIDSLPDLIRHLTGWQYRGQVASDAGLAGIALRSFGSSLVLDCGLVAFFITLVGLWLAWPGRPAGWRPKRPGMPAIGKLPSAKAASGSSGVPAARLCLGVPLLLIGLDLLLVVSYVAGPEDRQSYSLPAQLAWSVLAGLGLWLIVERWPSFRTLPLLLPLMVTPAAWNLLRNFEYCDLRDERSARTFVRETLDELPPGSLVLTTEWNHYSPYLYMRHVEGYRPDIAVVNLLMMPRFWYASYLAREMSGYVEAAGPRFDAFRRQVVRFDRGEPYDDAAIAASYASLIAAWVEAAQLRGGAWMDFGCLERARERAWVGRFQPVPAGLLLRLEEEPPAPGSVRPLVPKNAENLRYLRRRVGKLEAALRDPLGIDPTSVRHFKIYDSYRKAVEASLLFMALEGSRATMREWAAEYEAWFPDMPLVRANLSEKLRNAPSRPPAPAHDPLVERALRQLRDAQKKD